MMNLTIDEQDKLDGKHGKATQKAMQILVGLGKIYGAQRMIPVSSVQIAGVSYDNLGAAGLEFIEEMANGGGQASVLTTLNPAGMDIENWQRLGIDEEFAGNQIRVIESFARMGVITTCTCTPYLAGNLPHYGEHIAWAESSAACFANSVLGARTNREGGPGALAASLTGLTPEYGLHLDDSRKPDVTIEVENLSPVNRIQPRSYLFGALGKVIGQELEKEGKKTVPYIRGIEQASLEELKSFCASLATFGGIALFHLEGITPEAALFSPPSRIFKISKQDISNTLVMMQQTPSDEADFFSLGCPHLSIHEIAYLSKLLVGKKVQKEFWITTSRFTKNIADLMGYTRTIEQSGAKIAADTCCVVAPIKNRFKTMVTDSAKACYYGYAKNNFDTILKPFEEVVLLAVGKMKPEDRG
jgi:predicted aconitase